MNKAFTNFQWENDPSINTPLSAENLNRVNNAVNEIDNRVIGFDTTKANQTDMLTTIVDVKLNESNGVFTFTRKNGTTIELDTKLEKVVVNFSFDAETQILYLNLQDGTKLPIDLSAFVTNVEFENTATIRWEKVAGGKMKAYVIGGSITADMIEPNYLANVQLYSSQALSSANSAKEDANNARQNAELARQYNQGTQDMLQQVNKKLEIAEFTVDENGYLIYTDDTTYVFTVDNNGYLNWEVE